MHLLRDADRDLGVDLRDWRLSRAVKRDTSWWGCIYSLPTAANSRSGDAAEMMNKASCLRLTWSSHQPTSAPTSMDSCPFEQALALS
jgi:hypothetical protein